MNCLPITFRCVAETDRRERSKADFWIATGDRTTSLTTDTPVSKGEYDIVYSVVVTWVSSCGSTRLCIRLHYTITFLLSAFLPVATSCIVKPCSLSSEKFGKEPLISGGSRFRFLTKVDERLQRSHDLQRMRKVHQLGSSAISSGAPHLLELVFSILKI